MLALCGCPKSDVEIAASEFDRECAVASDCAPVFSGNVCAPCGCANDAIAGSAEKQYDDTLVDRRGSCGPSDPASCFCPPVVTACSSGTCTLAPRDAGTD